MKGTAVFVVMYLCALAMLSVLWMCLRWYLTQYSRPKEIRRGLTFRMLMYSQVVTIVVALASLTAITTEVFSKSDVSIIVVELLILASQLAILWAGETPVDKMRPSGSTAFPETLDIDRSARYCAVTAGASVSGLLMVMVVLIILG